MAPEEQVINGLNALIAHNRMGWQREAEHPQLDADHSDDYLKRKRELVNGLTSMRTEFEQLVYGGPD